MGESRGGGARWYSSSLACRTVPSLFRHQDSLSTPPVMETEVPSVSSANYMFVAQIDR